MDDCRSPITGDSWGVSEDWGKFRQLSLVPPAPSTKSPRWSDWHWSAGGRLVRTNLDNIQEEEECGDRCYLEQDLESLKEIRALYLDSALKSKSKSRAKEMMRGVRDKDRQIAWVEGKLRELESGCDQSGGDRHLSSSKMPDSPKLLEDKSDDGEISSSKMADPQKLLEDKNRDRQISSSKTRRHKGDGSGCIYWRTLTKNGKDYQQAYYHWREDGKQRTRYIPKGLLDRVQEAEAQKLPVADILFLLGGDEKCSSKSSDTSSTSPKDKKCSSKVSPPSKKRQQGYGAGYIECKPIKRSGKEYPQYWYHYEFWEKGDRLVKSCKYIPKGKLAQVQRLNEEKAPVREILKLLGVR